MKAGACWLKRDLFTSSMCAGEKRWRRFAFGRSGFRLGANEGGAAGEQGQKYITEQQAPEFAAGTMLLNLGG
jgi:hypothetical protein